MTDIRYGVVRSRRKTADIVIEPDGTVVVRAPEWTDDQQVASIVESKLYWIHKNLAQWRELNAARIVREYKNGEGFLYLGRAYRLLLVEDQKEPLLLKNGRFCLRRGAVDQGKGAAAFLAFYVERGQERISKRVHYFAPKVGVTPTQIDVRDLGNRWASCSAGGKLSFHWKCLMAPQTIIDYIVVHELCHFHHLDHTDAYWNEVDKVMPEYRERKAWLRHNGAGLDV